MTFHIMKRLFERSWAKGMLRESWSISGQTLASVSSFSHEELEPVFNGAMEEFDLKLGKVIQPLRGSNRHQREPGDSRGP